MKMEGTMRMRAMAIAVLVLVCALAGFARAGHELNAAVLAGNESKIREIIESGREGIDHKEEGKEGMTALFFATLLDKPDMVRHLMKEYNANPLIGDAKNYTPMDVAAFNGSYGSAKALLEHGKEAIVKNLVNKNADGLSPLHRAARSNTQEHADVIQLLVNNGADIDTRTSDASLKPRATAMHLAASLGNFEMLKSLMSYGADMHALDISGNTVLHAAVEKPKTRKHPRLVRYLLEAGANRAAQNYRGHTPYDVGMSAPVENAIMFDQVLPFELKLRTEEEIRYEEDLQKLHVDYMDKTDEMYSEESGVRIKRKGFKSDKDDDEEFDAEKDKEQRKKDALFELNSES